MLINRVDRIAEKLMEREFSHTEYPDPAYPNVGTPVYKQKYPTLRDAEIAVQLEDVFETFDGEAIITQCGAWPYDWDSEGY